MEAFRAAALIILMLSAKTYKIALTDWCLNYGKVRTCIIEEHQAPSMCHEVMGPDAMILVFEC